PVFSQYARTFLRKSNEYAINTLYHKCTVFVSFNYIITGTTIARAVEIGSILLLAYILLFDLLGWSDMDTALMTTLIASITCIEASLQMEKKRR
ncbi:TPA: hypothetical protein ACIRFB_001669, partial [Streptococcus suis]